ncbi:transposase, partial [Nostoc sp.]|uniref:transposase n=1 Tax=Nostoc sp. TaxID=1180 RepID=UPI0035940A2D
DAEWEIFEPLLQEILPTKKQTRPTNWPKRDIFNGILYQLKNGCNWQEIMTKIQFQLSTKPSKQEKAAQGKSGFVPAIARWVIERSNAWMERCKILVKNFERKKG